MKIIPNLNFLPLLRMTQYKKVEIVMLVRLKVILIVLNWKNTRANAVKEKIFILKNLKKNQYYVMKQRELFFVIGRKISLFVCFFLPEKGV